MSTEKLSPQEIDRRLQEIESKRATKRAEVEAQTKLRRLTDTEAISSIEDKLGAQNVAVREVAFIDADTPVLLAVRTPSAAMIDAYRAGVQKDPEEPDTITPAINLGIQCLVYPDRATYDRMVEARPGITVQLGLAALGLSASSEERRGKASPR